MTSGAVGRSAGGLGGGGLSSTGIGVASWGEVVGVGVGVVVMKYTSSVVVDEEEDSVGSRTEDWRRVNSVVRVEAPVKVDVYPGLTYVCDVIDGVPKSAGTPGTSYPLSPFVPGNGPSG